MIDWDIIFFEWKIWKVMGWVTGAVILAGLIFGIYFSCTGQFGF
jgi:hypothetical protein